MSRGWSVCEINKLFAGQTEQTRNAVTRERARQSTLTFARGLFCFGVFSPHRGGSSPFKTCHLGNFCGVPTPAHHTKKEDLKSSFLTYNSFVGLHQPISLHPRSINLYNDKMDKKYHEKNEINFATIELFGLFPLWLVFFTMFSGIFTYRIFVVLFLKFICIFNTNILLPVIYKGVPLHCGASPYTLFDYMGLANYDRINWLKIMSPIVFILCLIIIFLIVKREVTKKG